MTLIGRTGITLSPDEKILYVNDWDGNYSGRLTTSSPMEL